MNYLNALTCIAKSCVFDSVVGCGTLPRLRCSRSVYLPTIILVVYLSFNCQTMRKHNQQKNHYLLASRTRVQ